MSFRDLINEGLSEQGYAHRWKAEASVRCTDNSPKRYFVAPKAEGAEARDNLRDLPPRPWEDSSRSSADRLAEWHRTAAEAREKIGAPPAPKGALGKIVSYVTPGRQGPGYAPELDAHVREHHWPTYAGPRARPEHAGPRSVVLDPMPPGFGTRAAVEHGDAGARGPRGPGDWDAGTVRPTMTRRPAPHPNWVPSPDATGRPRLARRVAWSLRHAIRPLQRKTSPDGKFSRLAGCGTVCSAEGVGIIVNRESGRARFSGVQTCGSVWECPVCRSRICSQRATEVRQAVEDYWSPGRAVMVTATIAHGAGHKLKGLVRGLAKSWRAMTRGAPWRRFAERVGLHGTIRALEVTHGPNGWHPHIHAIFLLDDEPAGWTERGDWRDEANEWLIERWATMVKRHMGAEHEPRRDSVGFRVRPCRKAEYVAKLGLELADPGTKHGKMPDAEGYARAVDSVTPSGHRSPWGIAAAWRDSGDVRWAYLWREYCRAMRGARHLTWSRGLKQRAGIDERSDLDLTEDEEPTTDDVEIGRLTYEQWQVMRKAVARDGRPVPLWLLERVERDGAPMLPQLVTRAIRRLSA